MIVNVICPGCEGSGSTPDGDVCPLCLGQRHVAVNPEDDGAVPPGYRAWVDSRFSRER